MEGTNFLLSNLIIALLFSSVTTFIIGAFVLLKSKGNKANKIFAFYSFSIAWWTFFHALSVITKNPEESLIWSRIFFMGVWMIPVLTVHFFISLLNLKGRQWIIRIGYAQAIFFSIMNFTPYAMNETVSRFSFGYWIVPGIFFHLALIFFLIYAIYGFYELFRAYIKSSGQRRNQLVYLLWPSLLGYIGGSANFLLVYNVYVPILSPFGNYFVGIYTFIIAYAILKYQLMDIRLVIKKTFIYSIGIALISGFITGITFLSSWFMENIPGFRFWTIPLIVAVVAFYIGNLFWKKSKQVEEAYEIEKQAHKELKHLSEVKDQFILATQHHLRTPLTIIKGYLSIILGKDKEVSPEIRKEYMNKTLGSTNRLIKLVNELLDVSQLEMGKKPLEIQPTNIRSIVEDIIKELQPEIQKKNLSVEILSKNNKEWPIIPADPEKLTVVFSNLITNAIKYTPQGNIIIQCKKTNSSFQISIKDNGIGINPKEIPTLFTSYFERGEQAQKLYTTGRGIGLFITASIVKAHNGRIWAESEGLNKGSTFYVELPLEIK